MNMSFKFEKLRVWQIAMALGEEINSLALQFPEHEKFNLNSQMRRAIDSVALNISEGSIGQSNPEFKKFLGFSMRSLAEVVTCLYKAKYRNYIVESEFDQLYDKSFQLMNQLAALRKNLE